MSEMPDEEKTDRVAEDANETGDNETEKPIDTNTPDGNDQQ